MRAVARKKFIDKYTGEKYEAGDLLDLEPERYEEIRETDPDLVIAVEDEPVAAGQSAADDAKTEEGKTEPVAAGQSAADDAKTEEGKTEPVAAGQSAADDTETEESKTEPGAAGQSAADDAKAEDGKKESKKRAKKSDE